MKRWGPPRCLAHCEDAGSVDLVLKRSVLENDPSSGLLYPVVSASQFWNMLWSKIGPKADRVRRRPPTGRLETQRIKDTPIRVFKACAQAEAYTGPRHPERLS